MDKNSSNKNILLDTSLSKIGDIDEFEYIHGKFDFSISPDMCGTPVRSIRKKYSDKIIFSSNYQLELECNYIIKFHSGHFINVIITDVKKSKYYASVLPETI